jgi:hypothetical protein
MVAHERHITVTEDGRVEVADLPVRAGQKVRVTVAIEDSGRAQLGAAFRALFTTLRSRPQIQRLTDEEIAQEIDAYRRSLGAA